MTWLIFLFSLTLGVENTDFLLDGHQTDWHGYSEMEASALMWEHLELGGAIKTRFVPSGGLFFAPFQAEFIAFAQVRFGLLCLGAEHMCIHEFEDFYFKDDYNGYNRFYLRISNENREDTR